MDAEAASLPAARLDRAALRGFERVAVPFLDVCNLDPRAKSVLNVVPRQVSARWVAWATSRRWRLDGLEPVRALRPPRGVLLVSNHRTFWDMFVACAVLYRHCTFMGRLVFPVRANFFYSNPLGVLINLAIAGGGMWPPVFRDERKSALNPTGLAQMVEVLARPGTVLGIHPEGTRNKGPDPYAFLPVKPGVGQLIRSAHPDTVVLPFFIGGLQTELLPQIVDNFRARRRFPDVRVRFGEPRRTGDFDREQAPLALAETVLSAIAALGEADRSTLPAA
jgi:1-acyl-sn-glycerol-3-phosphate acyltransferase